MGNWITHSQTSEWWCVCVGQGRVTGVIVEYPGQWSTNGQPMDIHTWLDQPPLELTLLPSPASQCPMSLAISVINRCVRFGC